MCFTNITRRVLPDEGRTILGNFDQDIYCNTIVYIGESLFTYFASLAYVP